MSTQCCSAPYLLTVRITVKLHSKPYASCYPTHVTALAVHDDSCFIPGNKSTFHKSTMIKPQSSAIPLPGTTKWPPSIWWWKRARRRILETEADRTARNLQRKLIVSDQNRDWPSPRSMGPNQSGQKELPAGNHQHLLRV